MEQATPFTINVTDSLLDDLKKKLALTRLPQKQEFGAGNEWAQGSPIDDVAELARFWKEQYSWRDEEAKLNAELKHFKITLPLPGDAEGQQSVHFVHELSEDPSAIPLLVTHGWPGSFCEVRKIIKGLTHPKSGQAFHVVAPSLPGFGFSEAPKAPAQGVADIAFLWNRLMKALGYEKYVAHGGDYGSFITRTLAVKYPDNVQAAHITMIAAPKPEGWDESKATDFEKKSLANGAEFNKDGMAYVTIQASRPQTLSFALTDSPVGLLGWFYEKFHAWSDTRKGMPMTPTEIITGVMMHWIPGPESGIRLYKTVTDKGEIGAALFPDIRGNGVVVGASMFHHEIMQVPRSWAEGNNDIGFWKEHDVGGHFPSVEVPDLLIADLQSFFGSTQVQKAFSKGGKL